MTRTFRDWRSWRAGLRSCVLRAGATAVSTQLTAFGGTNAAASIPGLQGIGMNWKTAVVTLIIQFCFHCLYAAASYIQSNPDAQVVTETTDTTTFTKDSVTQRSTTTTTPVTPAESKTP